MCEDCPESSRRHISSSVAPQIAVHTLCLDQHIKPKQPNVRLANQYREKAFTLNDAVCASPQPTCLLA
ncbi:protein of unknown function [Methylocaldum szegediense]|uniref:Uncharacterized protein n=1 Tax=Methylocaldum szegediense TaxID=73780 RepID=A0ABN8XAI7_9GAMM|nr:protein of unknown function [Methylocaldum szegediense]